MTSANGNQAREALETLRHLPPGADPAPTGNPEAAALLTALRELPPPAAAGDWLVAHRARACARLALAEELHALRSIYLASAESGDDAAGVRLTDLADLDSDAAVAGAVARVRRSPETTTTAVDAGLALLTELVAGPDTDDPIGWLAVHRTELSVDRGIRLLVYEVRAAHQDIGPTTRELRPDDAGFDDPETGFAVRVRRLQIGTTAMLIESEAVVPLPGAEWPDRSRPARLHRLATWPGFSQVSDDKGNRYLVTRSEAEPRNGPEPSPELVRQVCFPALAPGVARLTLAADRYEIVEIRRDGQWTDRPAVHVEPVPISLSVDLPVPADA